MKTEHELVAAANDNFLASFRKVVEHSPEGEDRWFGSVFAFVTRLPISLFNGCVVVEAVDADELDAALGWLRTRDLPHRAFVAAELVAGLSAVVHEYGLERDPHPYPGMVLHPIPEPPPLPADVTVVPVADSEADEFMQVCAETGLPQRVVQGLYSPTFVADPDVQLFVARLDGRPVGKSLAIRSATSSGVYDVGTLESVRRRGVGGALTWAAIRAGREWGRDAVVLQSSQMGLSLYAAMGFRTVAPYTTFTGQSPTHATA